MGVYLLMFSGRLDPTLPYPISIPYREYTPPKLKRAPGAVGWAREDGRRPRSARRQAPWLEIPLGFLYF